MKVHWVGLVGDVGGTNARFALVDAQGHIRNPRSFPCKDYASLDAIVAEYIETTVGKKRPPKAVIAVAGPVMDGEIEFTNLDWRVSEGDLLAHFEFEAVELINDFAAQALACPLLEGADLRPLGKALPKGPHDCPIVALGAGTGFGVAGLARSERGDVAIPTEGGHAAFAPTDEVEIEVLRKLTAKYGRVSRERLLSGQGLYDLYTVLCELEGQAPALPDEMSVTKEGLVGDPMAALALDRFGGILGAVAGDLALTFGARGGVYVSGGIAPRIAERLAAGSFRARFEDKGRLSDYVAAIPTYLVLHPYPAIVGAARQLEQMERL
ncbi:MAG: glucokinase [Alphaproteobacteria bacterium]|nr:glucokinase [Alphaproteobacteria bacterium]MBU1514139.1 glucokinase [Alphaproteobacteria bacterium]MBU2096212.1 glucokinase [Alphaproteobacteria bacterium]MBU2151166.1 glucokinase [Alphaproteobacteria bacterium]MBU2307175.1 glucokinase [Alphaproteobacteria bacterium]